MPTRHVHILENNDKHEETDNYDQSVFYGEKYLNFMHKFFHDIYKLKI